MLGDGLGGGAEGGGSGGGNAGGGGDGDGGGGDGEGGGGEGGGDELSAVQSGCQWLTETHAGLADHAAEMAHLLAVLIWESAPTGNISEKSTTLETSQLLRSCGERACVPSHSRLGSRSHCVPAARSQRSPD